MKELIYRRSHLKKCYLKINYFAGNIKLEGLTYSKKRCPVLRNNIPNFCKSFLSVKNKGMGSSYT